MAVVKYKFSPQQIIGINHYFDKIADATFDEDDIRLLLFHLREFLTNDDNKSANARENAPLLREAGDSVAHTIRTRGPLHNRLAQLIPILARRHADLGAVPHPLFDARKIISALQGALIDSGVLYAPTRVAGVFAAATKDLQVCIISLLNGMVFRIGYPSIRKDFFFPPGSAKYFVYVRTEVECYFVGSSMQELRLNAALPYGGGKLLSTVLRCDLPGIDRIESGAINRTQSQDGYCEPIKALRRNGKLTICALAAKASSLEMFDVRRQFAYDTNPIPMSIVSLETAVRVTVPNIPPI